MIDQVGGRLHHTARAAAGAEAPVLAAEGDQVFMKAAVALDGQEAVFQQAAFQIIFELLAHESGKMAA